MIQNSPSLNEKLEVFYNFYGKIYSIFFLLAGLFTIIGMIIQMIETSDFGKIYPIILFLILIFVLSILIIVLWPLFLVILIGTWQIFSNVPEIWLYLIITGLISTIVSYWYSFKREPSHLTDLKENK